LLRSAHSLATENARSGHRWRADRLYRLRDPLVVVARIEIGRTHRHRLLLGGRPAKRAWRGVAEARRHASASDDAEISRSKSFDEIAPAASAAGADVWDESLNGRSPFFSMSAAR